MCRLPGWVGEAAAHQCEQQSLQWVAIAVGAMGLLGLADDRFGLSPMFRLAAALLVLTLTIVYAPEFRVEYLRFNGVPTLFLLPTWLSVVFTLVCLIGLLNAVNMADGKNGLVITLAIIWTSVLFAHNPKAFDPLLMAIIGCLVVLLVFNMKSALFLGDGGSYAVSAVFGLLAIYAYNQSFPTFGAAQVATMFLVPVLDTVRLMSWRIRHGRSPFAGDRNHLHHYLHARWDWPMGLAIYAALVATPNYLSVVFPEASLAWLGLGVLLYGLTLAVAARRGSFREGIST